MRNVEFYVETRIARSIRQHRVFDHGAVSTRSRLAIILVGVADDAESNQAGEVKVKPIGRHVEGLAERSNKACRTGRGIEPIEIVLTVQGLEHVVIGANVGPHHDLVVREPADCQPG